MEITFNYIRNRIREHSKDDLLDRCYSLLEKSDDVRMPKWNIFLLMKWTYIHGGYKRPAKELTTRKFTNILNSIMNFNQKHISDFIKQHKITESFFILHSQQFYLQTPVYRDKLAANLKLFHSLKSKYDIDSSFKEKTGISILEFSILMQAIWLYCNRGRFGRTKYHFHGYINDDFLEIGAMFTDEASTRKFLSFLTFDPNSDEHTILELSTRIKRAD